jgi:hypothetical protein
LVVGVPGVGGGGWVFGQDGRAAGLPQDGVHPFSRWLFGAGSPLVVGGGWVGVLLWGLGWLGCVC